MVGIAPFDEDPGGLSRYFDALREALEGTWPGGVNALVTSSGTEARHGYLVGAATGASTVRRVVGMSSRGVRALTHTRVVNVHFALYSPLIVLVARLRGQAVVGHWHGPWAEESRAAGDRSRFRVAMRRWFEGCVYRRAHAVVVLSEDFRLRLNATHGIPLDRIVKVAPGVDLERFRPSERQRADRGWRVVVARRLVSRMGIDVLVEAWAAISRQHPDAVLRVIGEGAERERLEGIAASRCEPGTVVFTGRVGDDQLVAEYQEADLAVVPTLELEGFGLVVLEALACGTPVIASDVGGLRDALGGLAPDLLVDAGSADALAQRILDAMSGSKPLPSRRDCRRFAEGFSWHSTALTIKSVLEAACSYAEKRRGTGGEG